MEIKISTDFTRSPAGRTPIEGNFSGERFREEYLLPALSKNESFSVSFDGLNGVGSSFWEEAFGGLIREGYTISFLREKMTLVCTDDDYLINYVWNFMEEASK